MDKKLFIHIGMPKAGSSFLQNQLLPVLESHGHLHYLNVQRMYEVAARIAFQDPFTYDAAATRKLIEGYLKPGINVMTVEWFSGVIGYKSFNTLETARRLWDTFPDATILLILRNQVDFAYSSYKQHIHQGGALSLNEYFNFKSNRIQRGFGYDIFRFDDHKMYWNSLLYSHLIKAYEPFSQKQRFRLFLFEQFRRSPRDFAARLHEVMGLDVDLGIFDFTPINRGYGRRQIRIARFLNRLVYSPYNQIGIKPMPWFGKTGALQATHVRRVLQSDISFKLLGNKSIRNEAIDEQIRQFYFEDNGKVLDCLDDRDREIFRRAYLSLE